MVRILSWTGGRLSGNLRSCTRGSSAANPLPPPPLLPPRHVSYLTPAFLPFTPRQQQPRALPLSRGRALRAPFPPPHPAAAAFTPRLPHCSRGGRRGRGGKALQRGAGAPQGLATLLTPAVGRTAPRLLLRWHRKQQMKLLSKTCACSFETPARRLHANTERLKHASTRSLAEHLRP